MKVTVVDRNFYCGEVFESNGITISGGLVVKNRLAVDNTGKYANGTALR